MHALAEEVRRFALGLPEVHEDFPWGESVAKVRGKVFVFFGRSNALDRELSISVKLPQSGQSILSLPFAEPTGYGLGKSGWVTVRCTPNEAVPGELLCEWITESYRAIAPKKLTRIIPHGTAARA